MPGNPLFAAVILAALLIATLVAVVSFGDESSGEARLYEAADVKLQPIIYFGTYKGGLQAYSMSASEVMNVWGNSSEIVYGVTYDSVEDKIYWSSPDWIYKGNRDGSQVETVFNTDDECGTPYGLDFDWITGNLYVSTYGCIVACKTRTESAYQCAKIVRGLRDVHGIALHPAEGIMFWTTWDSNGTLNRAGMDGANPIILTTGLSFSECITIDFHKSRLYWTCGGFGQDNKIESSDMDGTDMKTVLELPEDSWPWGIILFEDRIFWTNYITRKLENGAKTGQDIRLLHSANKGLHQLVVLPRPNISTNPKNHCENQDCSNRVCVLTPASFKCVS